MHIYEALVSDSQETRLTLWVLWHPQDYGCL